MSIEVSPDEKHGERSPLSMSRNIEALLQEVSCQFLEMVPVRRMRWKSEIPDGDAVSPDVQRQVLRVTVQHPLCFKFPPALTYQKTFMRQFIQMLESFEIEICDEIYECYTDLLQQQEEDDDTLCHKSYRLPNGTYVSLQESVNLVSFGTTGLSTWQAALYLAEWAFENSAIFEKRKVLELGSGLGITGSAICKECNPAKYYFTDCHPQVLFLLSKNLELNFSGSSFVSAKYSCSPTRNKEATILKKIRRQLSLNTESMLTELGDIVCVSPTSPPAECDNTIEGLINDLADIELSLHYWSKDTVSFLGSLKASSQIHLAKLDWTEPREETMKALDADVIIAADVVYDASIIPALVSVLQHFLASESCCKSAYIASTVRNEETQEQFVSALASAGLQYENVTPPCKRTFHYDRSVPIEIIKIF